MSTTVIQLHTLLIMIVKIDCSVFDSPSQAIIHQANCFNTMGSGIACQIRQRYPEAYEADCKTISGDRSKLGKFSWVKTNDGKYHIYNCYSQYQYGRDQRQTSHFGTRTA
jgi:O-acetyl-ADP-ribose deacetylase (regulator of RNase III)